MLGQYFILQREILQSEFSVSLFKAAGDILLKKGVFLLRGPARVNSDKRHDPKSSDRA